MCNNVGVCYRVIQCTCRPLNLPGCGNSTYVSKKVYSLYKYNKNDNDDDDVDKMQMNKNKV